jgi:hypothetical protein
MTKHIVYRLASGKQEYTATAEEFDALAKKHPGSFIKIREEGSKEVRTPIAGAEQGKPKSVPPAPGADKVKGKKERTKAQPSTPKAVKRGPDAQVAKPPASQPNEASNATGSGGDKE